MSGAGLKEEAVITPVPCASLVRRLCIFCKHSVMSLMEYQYVIRQSQLTHSDSVLFFCNTTLTSASGFEQQVTLWRCTLFKQCTCGH